MAIETRYDPTAITQTGKALRAYAESLGAEVYGVASAEAYVQRFPDKPAPSRFVEDARSVIVIGLPYEPGTVATVLRPELANLRAKATDNVGASSARPVGAERFFLGEENGVLRHELTLMGYKIARFLRHEGWMALYLPPGKQNDRFRTAPFYHMPAMYLAGLGTLGLNCCILTPQFGPRVYITSIITDCPLPTGQPLREELCTRCALCVQSCPINAIDGQGWKNPHACASYGCCGTCIAVCPVGEVYPARSGVRVRDEHYAPVRGEPRLARVGEAEHDVHGLRAAHAPRDDARHRLIGCFHGGRPAIAARL